MLQRGQRCPSDPRPQQALALDRLRLLVDLKLHQRLHWIDGEKAQPGARFITLTNGAGRLNGEAGIRVACNHAALGYSVSY
jgi:hypothetical protein